jgi:hypothetical protein
MTAMPPDDHPRFLTDENFEPAIVAGLRRKRPAIDIQTAIEAGTRTMPDPLVLSYAAAHDRILISHDMRTVPTHFGEFLAHGGHSPGGMLVSSRLAIGLAIDALLLIWDASRHGEWRDMMTRMPL